MLYNLIKRVKVNDVKKPIFKKTEFKWQQRNEEDKPMFNEDGSKKWAQEDVDEPSVIANIFGDKIKDTFLEEKPDLLDTEEWWREFQEKVKEGRIRPQSLGAGEALT